jgi:hypothetical protein
LLPKDNYVLGPKELIDAQSIDFSWNTVQNATTYIFTLYQIGADNTKKEITRSQIKTAAQTRVSFTIDDLSVLDNGTFVWQVEPVRQDADGGIEQRGSSASHTFIIDIPLPDELELYDAGTLYGR